MHLRKLGLPALAAYLGASYVYRWGHGDGRSYERHYLTSW